MEGFAYRPTPIVSWLLIYLTSVQPLHPAIAAGIQPDNAQTQVRVHGQIPVVNIARPNAAGVSHNRYHDFNVSPIGAILNNAKTAGYSTWAVGHLAANPNLGGNSAQLIINEVTSRHHSSLEGMLNIFGEKANVIIANPNGISCNGCWFNNVGAITLTTGTPVLNRLGELEWLNVQGGTITVGNKGLTALSQKDTVFISRQLNLNGEVDAKQLDIILGTNKIDYQNGHIEPLSVMGATPALAIDTRALGGMYADRIRLVSKEKGAGADLKNIFGAEGNVTFDIAGNITLGNILAKKDLNILGGNTTITVDSELLSGGDVTLVTTELNNFSKVKAVGDVRIFSDKVHNVGPSAELHARHHMWIQKDAEGNKNKLVENKSGSIKTNLGDLIIRTDKLDNSRQVFNVGWQELTPDSIHAYIYDYDNIYYPPVRKTIELSAEQFPAEFPTEWFDTADVRLINERAKWFLYKINTERKLYQITATTPAATIHSGNNLYINASQLTNSVSNISAPKDIFLTGNEFLNNSHSDWREDTFVNYNVQEGMHHRNHAREDDWYIRWTELDKNNGTISSGRNVVLDFNNSIQLQPLLSWPHSQFGFGFELKKPTQPVVLGHNILLHAKSITSNYLIQARGDITFVADDTIHLNNTTLQGRDISFSALNDINSVHGEFLGRDITLLSRQGDVLFEPEYHSEYYLQPSHQRIISEVNAKGDFTVIAGKNINLTDTLIHPANNIFLSANHDINVKHSKNLIDEINGGEILNREQSIQHINRLFYLPGKLKSHQDITFSAGNNLTLHGVTLESEQDINLHAARDIELSPRDITFTFDSLLDPYSSFPYDDLQLFFPSSRTPELSTQINAKGNLLINAGRDILSQASKITVGNNLNLLAGRDIRLTASLYSGLDNPEGNQRQDRHVMTRLLAGNALNAVSGHQLLAQGAELSSGGDMMLTSGDNMRFESLLNEQHQGGGDNFSYNKLQQPTQLKSGGILTLISNGSILFQATQLAAKKVMDIAAEGGYLFAQAMEETSHAEERWNTRKWWGRRKSHHNVQHVATNKVTEFTADDNINLLSRDDSTYQASKIAAGQNARLTSTHGRVNFEAVKDSSFEQKTTVSKGFYIKHTDKGYQDEKWILPIIHTGGELTIDAAQGVSADIKVRNEQSLHDAVIALGNTPGNEWLKTLNLRDDVQWQKVMDTYHRWDHRSQQLNPVVAVVIAIAVAAATAGSGLAVTAGTAAGGGMAGGAVTAGISSLASQAAVSLVNNEGDISKTFRELGSKSSVKSLVTSMAVGGALSGFDAAMGVGSAADSVNAAQLPQLSNCDWNKVVQRVAGQSIISSSLNTGINGGSFKDNFTTALLANTGAQLHAEGAHVIGNNGRVLGAPGKALSHALVAGIAAEISGGNKEGAAAGALAAELAGAVLGDNLIGTQHWQEQQAQLSRVAGALAGALASSKAEGAYSGADAAEVVERFNRQLHQEEIKAINELAQGNNIKQERFMAASCRQVNCSAQESLNSSERIRAEALMVKYPETPEEDSILARYWIQKEKQRFGNYPALTGFEQVQLFTYTDVDTLSDSQIFAKNQWVEEAGKITGWSEETIEALGLSASLAASLRGKRFEQRASVYPAGISFNINLKNHLAKFDGFSQRKGIHGTHNANAFNQAVSVNGVKVINRAFGQVKGITHVKYQIPAKDRVGNTVGYKADIFEKTIYDPKVFSDEKMLKLGQQAAANGYHSARDLGAREYRAESNGIKFQIFLDQHSGTVINFFPVIK